MKLHQIITAFWAVAVLTGSALAANPSTQSTANLIDTAKLDGKQVKNLQGEDLGEIKQVLLDPQTGQVRYAVVQVNKAWNWNDPEVAVPWGAFKVSGKVEDNNLQLSLDATKQKLEGAPKFKAGDADRLYLKDSAQPIYTYWSIMWIENAPSTESATPGKSEAGATAPSSTPPSPNPSTAPNSGKADNPATSPDKGTSTSPGTGASTVSPNQQTTPPATPPKP